MLGSVERVTEGHGGNISMSGRDQPGNGLGPVEASSAGSCALCQTWKTSMGVLHLPGADLSHSFAAAGPFLG